MAVPATQPMTAFTEKQAADAAAAIAESARGFDYNHYRPLHMALLRGDWEAATKFFDDDPNALLNKVTPNSMTALQLAAAGGQWEIVEKLVERMPAESLAVQDWMGCTALHSAVMGGSTKAAKALVTKNPSLTRITNLANQTPLLLAIVSATTKDLVWYLASATTDGSSGCPFSGSSSGFLIAALTAAGHHDITLYLVHRFPQLAITSDENGNCILHALSKMPTYFRSGIKLALLERWIYQYVPVELDHSSPSSHPRGDVEDPYDKLSNRQSSLIWKTMENLVPMIKRVKETKLRHLSSMRLVKYVCLQGSTNRGAEFWHSDVSAKILSNAASFGIVEMIKICCQSSPDLIWSYIPNEGYILQIAIKNRRENVFKLIRKLPICKNFLMLDECENTISHLAGRLVPSAEGEIASVQMQKELKWFKEVEKLDHALHKDAKNRDGKTPWQLFKDEHNGLHQQAKKWMKETSNSSMLVATFLATVVFAIAFTVPGGNNGNNGIPLLLGNDNFIWFIVFDALTLIFSLVSLVMFLSIFTARYAEGDFLEVLPKRLISGLATLLLAITTAMLTFGFAIYLVMEKRLQWVGNLLILAVGLPIFIFEVLELPLLLQMVRSTYGTGIYQSQSLYGDTIDMEENSWLLQ